MSSFIFIKYFSVQIELQKSKIQIQIETSTNNAIRISDKIQRIVFYFTTILALIVKKKTRASKMAAYLVQQQSYKQPCRTVYCFEVYSNDIMTLKNSKQRSYFCRIIYT